MSEKTPLMVIAEEAREKVDEMKKLTTIKNILLVAIAFSAVLAYAMLNRYELAPNGWITLDRWTGESWKGPKR